MALVQGPSLPTLTPMSVQGTGWTTINISYVVTHALYLPHVIFPDTLQVGGIVSLLQVGNVELRAGTWLPGVSTVVDSCLPGHVPSLLSRHSGFQAGPRTRQALSASRPLHMLSPHPGPLLSVFLADSRILFFIFLLW